MDRRIRAESHFAPAPPGCSFKAMMPGEGYWELVREQKQELAHQEWDQEDARKVREERARQKRWRCCSRPTIPLMPEQAQTPAPGDTAGKIVAPEMDPSNAKNSNLVVSTVSMFLRELFHYFQTIARVATHQKVSCIII
jgi:hypothetical protein